MRPKFLLDEQLRSRAIWDALQVKIAGGIPLDVARVGDPGAPLPATKDPQLLDEAAAFGRILISRDMATMRDHFAAFLASGRTSPGIVFLHGTLTVPELIQWLEVMSVESSSDEFVDTVVWIP